MSVRDFLSHDFETFSEVSAKMKKAGFPMAEIQLRKAVLAFPDVIIRGNTVRIQATVN
jgi:hypothetical protein